MSTTVDINLTLDVKKIVKWLTIILCISLVIMPFFGMRELNEKGEFAEYVSAESILWVIIQGKLFFLRDAAWLWVLFMLMTPVTMHFTKNSNNIGSWMLRVVSSLLSFLGALLLIVAWTKKTQIMGASMAGTWIYMITSFLVFALTAYEGKDYLTKK